MKHSCWSDEERERRREEFKNRYADNILGFDRLLYFYLSVPNLMMVMQNSLKYSDIEKKVLRRFVSVGVLDFSQTGNYSAESILFKGYNLNPRLNGDLLYFVSGKQCENYGEGIDRGNRRSITGLQRVVKHGDFEIPDEIDSRMWRMLRLKSWDKQERIVRTEDVVRMLVEREVLTPKEKGNYSVEYTYHHGNVSETISLCFLGGESANWRKKYFFTEQRFAHSYADSFPRGVKVGVFKND